MLLVSAGLFAGESYPMTITDSYGRNITIESEPKRIISLAPSITETIFVLEKEDKLIGRTDYCDYPKAASEVVTVGTLREPSIETIAALNPDLVIASTHFNKATLKKLDSLGIKTVVLYGEESFEGVYTVINTTGKILNAETKAEEVVSEMKKDVEFVLNTVKDAEKPSVYYVVGFGEYGDFTAGGDTFISDLIHMAGGVNAASDLTGWKYSLEKVVENNPDILICSAFWGAKEQLISANGYKDLPAVKEGRLLEIDNNLLDRQGPRLAKGLKALAALIHPELFPQ